MYRESEVEITLRLAKWFGYDLGYWARRLTGERIKLH